MRLQLRAGVKRAWVVVRVYRAVRRHVEVGCVLLRPPDTPGVDAETKYLTLQMWHGIAIINRYGWDTAIIRQYLIDVRGHVEKRLFDPTGFAMPSAEDRHWLNQSFTLRRMRYLERAVAEGEYYSPRQIPWQMAR